MTGSLISFHDEAVFVLFSCWESDDDSGSSLTSLKIEFMQRSVENSYQIVVTKVSSRKFLTMGKASSTPEKCERQQNRWNDAVLSENNHE